MTTALGATVRGRGVGGVGSGIEVHDPVEHRLPLLANARLDRIALPPQPGSAARGSSRDRTKTSARGRFAVSRGRRWPPPPTPVAHPSRPSCARPSSSRADRARAEPIVQRERGLAEVYRGRRRGLFALRHLGPRLRLRQMRSVPAVADGGILMQAAWVMQFMRRQADDERGRTPGRRSDPCGAGAAVGAYVPI
jgi:hypothetical protein